MSSDVPYLYQAPTTFHVDGEEHQPLDEGFLNLPIGAGVVWTDGRRFRVVDSWFSFDSHGVVDSGLHLWLEPCPPGQDRPARENPAYYEDAQEPVLDRFVPTPDSLRM